MKFLVLLLVTVLICSSYGISVSGGAEFDILAEFHHRVARAASSPTAGPTGPGTTERPVTGSTGSSPNSTSPNSTVTTSPPTSYVTGPACMQAYQQIFDKCLTPSGVNLSDLGTGETRLSAVRQLFSYLCPNSECKNSFLNYYRVCAPFGSLPISVDDFVDHWRNTFERFCKVNEFGSFCAETFYSFIQPSSCFSQAQICLNPQVSCSSEASQCRMLLQNVSSSEGCCALETYQVYVESAKLYFPSNSSLCPDDIWTSCGLPSPGQCPSPSCGTTTKPVESDFLTKIKVIDRVWPYIDSDKFIANFHSSLTVRPPGSGQSWAVVFDSELESRREFSIVSFPNLRQIIRVQHQCSGTHKLVVEDIPHDVYFVQGEKFYNFGPDYIFTAKDNYIFSRFRGKFIQHVDSGLVLNYDYASSVFLSPLRKNTFSQAWVYRALKGRLFTHREVD